MNISSISNLGVTYQCYLQNTGWQNWVSNGQLSGTVGQSIRVEAIRINLLNAPTGAKIKYRCHMQNFGWLNWVYDGAVSGLVNQSKRLEAISIALEGLPLGYHVAYRAHVQDIGWQNWVLDGQVAGTVGLSKRLEAIEIFILKDDVGVIYQSHIQDLGWQNSVYNCTLSGTVGQSKRLEAVKIQLANAPLGARIKYKSHIQDIGWQDWFYDGATSGTVGQSKRLEAISMILENMPTGYHVEYRAHVQGLGWLPWQRDGSIAGTTGKSLRLEAIEIFISKDTTNISKVIETSSNIFIGPSNSLDIVRTLPQDSIINIFQESNGWYKLGNNQWIFKKSTIPTSLDCSIYDNTTLSWYYIPAPQNVIPAANTEISKFNGYYIFNSNSKVIYLTFDLGYEAGYTNTILDTLKNKEVKAVFFVTGNYIDNNPTLIKRMVNEGHIVANHTVNHPTLPDLADTPALFNAEILGVENKYKSVTGKDILKMLRPPSGYYSYKTLCLLEQLKYSTVFWSFAYNDWDTNNQPDPVFALNKIISSVHPGAIYLLHGVSSTNTSILATVIDRMRALGYSLQQLLL
nr:polysaccharide deacetylase family protein [Clostridium cellulovorans]